MTERPEDDLTFRHGLPVHEEPVDPEHPDQHRVHVGTDTVEAAVRRQLSTALGGKRGMAEAALPTIAFTATFVTTKEVGLAVAVSVGLALVLLAVRLVQRSSVQFVLNALFGIGVGVFFVWLGGRNGGDESHKALAYFLPGLLYNAGYAVVIVLSILLRFPVVGAMVGAMAEDPVAWRRDPQVLRLCSQLTWPLAAPCVLRVVAQGPVYLAGRSADDADAYVAALGVLKVVMGWPLQLAALGFMVWLLSRDRTPATAVTT
ncbi:DUF3159 domain-containing protein [Nocardioides marmoribigeumensis]|uniref:DUF3159 domain-containing protein n=1 Tax=Nocardioides marmoribigeumensis TaxID=433649 RepID=A0ABU2BR91_9ACTN|nr:DUF3159 domain-containing protein [Nocardioides marmoribigeumensis]MDR7361149.1 hypothetical protein [Nocardioides marmoribigeumensis]